MAMLRYGSEYNGPWAGDAIPLAAAGHRIGMPPGLAGEVLSHYRWLGVDKAKRIVRE